MGTLRFNTWQNPDGTQNFKCRAWVNFDGTGTVSIRAGGNVSSITDRGVGQYTINFTSALPDTNYSTAGGALGANGNDASFFVYTTSSVQLDIYDGNQYMDRSVVTAIIVR